MVVETHLLVIGSVLAVIVFLFISINAGTDVYNILRHGSCWGDLKNTVDYFHKAYTQPSLYAPRFKGDKEIKLGQCVGAVAFINAEELGQFADEFASRGLECDNGEAYIIGIPYYQDTESGWKFWLWPKDVFENIGNTWNSAVRGMKPYCKALKKPFDGTTDPMLGPNKDGGSDYYCVTDIHKEKDNNGNEKYYIQYSEGKCETEEESE